MTHTTVSDDQLSAAFESAALLCERGWCQGQFGFGTSCRCAWGAILEVSSTDVLLYAAMLRRWCGVIGVNPENFEGLPSWNDAPDRTQTEVVAKLREAAQLAKANV